MLRYPLEGHTGDVNTVAMTAESVNASSPGGSDGTVRVWTWTVGRLERTVEAHAVSVSRWRLRPTANTSCPGEPTETSTRDEMDAEDGTVRVWNLASGDLEQPSRTGTR